MSVPPLTLPPALLPADGRFGSGPSKVRQEAVSALADVAPALLGTSHRQEPVRRLVRRIRQGLTDYFALPDGYEVVLGNGGATLIWDALVHGVIRRRSAHAVFGEFSSKFAAAVRAAPFLDDPVVVESEAGTHPVVTPRDGVDAWALTHNETSTGVAMPVRRPAGDALVLVDATSAAGSLEVDPREFDVYYGSPQKGFASEGGLFLALLSPAAVERLAAGTGRHVPASLDLRLALDNSRQDQTYNTPAIATLFLLADAVERLLDEGGLAAVAKHTTAKAGVLYRWAQDRPFASPFVADPAQRSPVTVTIDFSDGIDAAAIAAALRANGVVDVEPYRKLGRNQLRIATFPAVDHADVEALAACIDWIVDRLT